MVLEPRAEAFAEALRNFDRDRTADASAAAREFVLRENSLAAFARRWREALAL
jgi:hypothetical protein